MKARLIKPQTGSVRVLYSDGTYATQSYFVVKRFMTEFRQADNFTGNKGIWNNEYLDMAEVPGTTLGFISDSLQLVLLDPWPVDYLTNCEDKPEVEGYVSTKEYAEMYDRSQITIKKLCQNGRIPGATKVNLEWLIPVNAPYPIPVSQRKPTSGYRKLN